MRLHLPLDVLAHLQTTNPYREHTAWISWMRCRQSAAQMLLCNKGEGGWLWLRQFRRC